MSNDILDAVRLKYPTYKDWGDDELTLAIGRRYPVYLKDPAFGQVFKAREAQESNQAQTDAQRGFLAAAKGVREVVTETGGNLLGAVADAGRRAGAAVGTGVEPWRKAILDSTTEDWKRAAFATVQDLARAAATSPAEHFGLPSGGKILKETSRLAGEDARSLTDAMNLDPEGVPAGIVTGTARALPLIAAGAAGARGGLPRPAAFGFPAFDQTFAETGDLGKASKAASVMGLLPEFGEFGSAAGEKVGAQLAGRVSSPVVQRALITTGKILGSQSMLNGLMVASEAPELIELARTDPAAARKELLKIVGGNLAFELPHLPRLARETLAREHVDAYMQSPDYRRDLDNLIEAQRARGTRELIWEQPAEKAAPAAEVPAAETTPPVEPPPEAPPPETKEETTAPPPAPAEEPPSAPPSAPPAPAEEPPSAPPTETKEETTAAEPPAPTREVPPAPAAPPDVAPPEPEPKRVVYQGRGNTLEQIYGPEAVQEGRAGPLFGRAQYYAHKAADAEIYGKVTRHEIKPLKKPFLLNSDAEWFTLLRAADAYHLNNMGEEFYREPHKVLAAGEKVQKFLREQGYDGIEITLDPHSDKTRRMAAMVGHDQTVVFEGKAKPTAPPPVDVAPTGEQGASGTTYGTGQSGTGVSGVDVREPAGAGAADAPREPSGGAPGEPGADGPKVRGSTEGGTGDGGGRGVRDRQPDVPVAGERAGDDGGSAAGAPASEGAGSGVSEPKPEDLNHVLPADKDWIPTGDKAKVRANLEAIKLLKRLEAEKRNPTAAEKEILARYTGWGGLKEVFDEGKAAYRKSPPRWEEQQRESANWEKNWGDVYDEVKSAMTPEEWGRAQRSILNAHYTSRSVINAVWEGVQRLGFKGGKALEPSVGIGHFIGLTPEGLRGKTRWRAIDKDSVSARLAAKLYPESRVEQGGFEDSKVPASSQDLVISNFPFAKSGPQDKRYPNLSLHNYFFARGLDALKPGGILAAITSDSTMDSPSSREAREWLADRADLVGAIRLPNTAFKKNAGTEVTTDILFFRKRDGTPFKGQDFLRTTEAPSRKGEPVEINEYFAQHPDMMLGQMSREGTMYGPDQQALMPTPGADLGDQMKEAVGKLPENVFGAQSTPEAATEAAGAAVAAQGTKVGQLTTDSTGGMKQVSADGTLVAPEWAGDKEAVTQAKRYMGVRDAATELRTLQARPDATDEQLATSRKKLNEQYDAYVKKHGDLNGRATKWLNEEDVDYPFVLSLEDGKTRTEIVGGKERKTTDWSKAKIFTERTVYPRQAPARADTVEDGLQISLNYTGRVDPEYISRLTGDSFEAVTDQLRSGGRAFENPDSGLWENRAQYLSGDVKGKLEKARAAAADDPRFAGNVAELEKALPPPVPISNITVRLGSRWVPPEVIESFLRDHIGMEAKVSLTPETGTWHVEPRAGGQSARNLSVFGIHDFAGHELVELALNLKSPKVTRSVTNADGSTSTTKDGPKTLEATAKQEELNAAFKQYAATKPEVASRLEAEFNDRFTGVVRPKFEAPSWDQYPGATKDVTLRQDQKEAVTRMLSNSTLLAHAPGNGKTFVIVTAAMEMRRLGLAKKPMVVVQNSTLEQFGRSFMRLYPGAKILVPGEKARDATNRNRTMSRIATGDWDAVIIPQSFVDLLPNQLERERTYMRERLAQLQEALIAARAEAGKKSPKASDLVKAIEKLEGRLAELADRKVDNVLTFEELGVDALFVDEAHAYKKLEFSTAMENIKGLDTSASKRGLSMLMKVRWVQEQNQGRNVTFATGTPVSNTIAEAWTMMRYLRPDILKRFEIEDFDSFVGLFADKKTETVMTAAGTWKEETRLAQFTNAQQLMDAWLTTADVVTQEQVNLPGLPALKNKRVTQVVIKQTPALKNYVAFLRAELERFAAMSGREKRDNSHIPLVVFGNAKKATLDMRLIDPDLPDEPGSKLNIAAQHIVDRWRESTPILGTQMVFADLFQDNPDNPRFNLYEAMKAKLGSLGIPESQIEIVQGLKGAKLDAIFQKFREGSVRVMLGSSSKMGVGVDVPDRHYALHHLDAPSRPMDVEQRDARAIRQGNKNKVVEILAYGVENTLDAAMYQKLAGKQKFVNQILRGDILGDKFEDAANEQSMSFEEQMAAFSGDPRAMQKVGLTNQVRDLTSLQKGHYQQVRKANESVLELKAVQLPHTRRTIERADARVAEIDAAFPPDFEPVLTGSNKTITGRKEVVEALDKLFKKQSDDFFEDVTKRKQFGRQVSSEFKLKLNGQEIAARISIPADQAGKPVREQAAVDWTFPDGRGGSVRTGVGFFSSLTGVLENIRRQPAHARESLAAQERNLTELEGFVTQPFAREAELKSATAELERLTAELKAEGAAPAAGAGGTGGGDEGGDGGGDVALQSPQKATLPLNIQPAKGLAPGDPVGLAQIRRYLAESLDIPVRMRGFSERAVGIFKPKSGVIRMKALNDVATLTHEVGHYFHQLLFGNSDFAGAYDSELLSLGARTSRPTYTQKMVRKEGMAEFLRLYLTDPPQALAQASSFTPFFENALKTGFPETWEIVQRAQADIQRYIQQPAQAKIRSMISRDAKVYRGPLGERISSGLSRLYTAWVNNLHPYERSVGYLRRLGLHPTIARTTTDYAVNYIGGWRGKVEHTLHYRQTDLAGNDVGPGLREILSGVENLEDLGDYLIAERAVELAGRGKQTGIDPNDARTVVANLGPKYSRVKDRLRDFQRHNLLMMVESGIISPRDAIKMESENADYVPFYRVMEPAGFRGAAPGPKAGAGFVNTGKGVRRFKGSDREIVDPLESIIKNTYLFRDLAERNQVGVAFVKAIEQVDGGGRVADPIAKQITPTQVAHDEVIKALQAAGVDTAALGLDSLNLATTIWRAAHRQRDPATGIWTVWRGGKEQRWQTDDAELYKALSLSDGSDAKMASNFLAAGLRKVASALRAGAVLAPEFMVRNPIRDQLTAGVFARGGYVPFWDGARGLFHVLRKDGVYQDWLKSGGAHSHLTALDRPNLREALADVVKDPGMLQQALTWADPRNVLKNLSEISRAMEEATRVQAFRNAQKSGMTDREAANASKDATINFARGGEWGRWLNRYSAFFNASVQDLDLFARMHDPRNPRQLAKVAAKGFFYITAPSLIAWWLGKDDKAIQDLPDWRRNFFWNINAGRMMGKPDFVLSLPKPFLLGQVYGSSVERGLDFATGRDPNAVQKWFLGVLQSTPLVPEQWLPTALKPPLEWFANRSFFRDQPLESESMKHLPPSMRFTPGSSVLSRTISGMLPETWGGSPVKIDNTLRGMFGGVGKYGTDATDWMLMKMGVADVPPPPAKGVGEWPVVRAFTVSPYTASAYVDRFYQAAKSAEELVNGARKAPDMMSTEENERWFTAQEPRLAHYLAGGDKTTIQGIRAASKQLSDIHKASVNIQNDRSMSPEEKRARLIDLARLRDEVAETAFKGLIAPVDQLRFH